MAIYHASYTFKSVILKMDIVFESLWEHLCDFSPIALFISSRIFLKVYYSEPTSVHLKYVQYKKNRVQK